MGAAAWKWVGITADIVAYEVAHWHDEEMLTYVAHRWIERNPIAARVAILSAGALITGHLARLIDSRYDPLSKGFYLWNRGARVAMDVAAAVLDE